MSGIEERWHKTQTQSCPKPVKSITSWDSVINGIKEISLYFMLLLGLGDVPGK